jgi:hypothetical protein
MNIEKVLDGTVDKAKFQRGRGGISLLIQAGYEIIEDDLGTVIVFQGQAVEHMKDAAWKLLEAGYQVRMVGDSPMLRITE